MTKFLREYHFGLKRLKEVIDNFNPKNAVEFCRCGETIEDYKQSLVNCYITCSEFAETIEVYEIQLLMYFRNIPRAMRYRYFDLLKKASYLSNDFENFLRLPFIVD